MIKTIRILGMGILLAGGLFAQNKSADESAIRTLIANYVDARERIDPQDTQKLFTENADQLVSTGEWRKGREKLVAGAMQSSRTAQGKRTITVETIRFLNADAAIVDGRYVIEAKEPSNTRRMWATFVVTRSGNDWQISAIRNMLPTNPQ